MATYTNQNYTGAQINVQGNVYNGCSFTRCILEYGTGSATFQSNCIFYNSQLVWPINNSVSRSYHRYCTFEACDIDTAFKEFENSSFTKCFLMDGCRTKPSVSSFDKSMGTYWSRNNFYDTVLSGPEPYWLYSPTNNIFYGYLRSMPIYFDMNTNSSTYYKVYKDWSMLKDGATIFGSGTCYGNTFATPPDNLTLLGTSFIGVSFNQGGVGRKVRNAKISFSVLNDLGYMSFEDSVMSYCGSMYGPQPAIGSRTLADSNSLLQPHNICESSSFADSTVSFRTTSANEHGSFRNTSFKGSVFTDSNYRSISTLNTNVSGAENAGPALDPTGVIDIGGYVPKANNLSGTTNISNLGDTLFVTPTIAPGTAYIAASYLAIGYQYNYVVEDSISSNIKLYVLSYGALEKAGISGPTLTYTASQLAAIETYAAMSGEQLQDLCNSGFASFGYLVVVNKSATTTYSVGISSRTGIIDASSLVPGSTYDLVNMTTVPGISYSSDYGTLHYNRSVDGNVLTSQGRTFTSGFGCHANCTITVPVTNAATVGVYTGFAYDDEIHSSAPANVGSVKYVLQSGATVLYDQGYTAYNVPPKWKFLPNQGSSSVQLKGVAPSGIGSAHVDFLYPTLIVSRSAVPTLSTVSPSSGDGSSYSYNTVTLTGTNFEVGATVLFGSLPATSVNRISSTSITCIPPALTFVSNTTVNVTVTNLSKLSVTKASAYTYVNVAPTDIALSSTVVGQGLPIGTVIGALSSVDGNLGDTFTYSLVSGTGSTDNASFTVSGANLLSAEVFSVAVKSSYAIRLRTTDRSGGTYEKQFTITVSPIPFMIDSNTVMAYDFTSATNGASTIEDLTANNYDLNMMLQTTINDNSVTSGSASTATITSEGLVLNNGVYGVNTNANMGTILSSTSLTYEMRFKLKAYSRAWPSSTLISCLAEQSGNYGAEVDTYSAADHVVRAFANVSQHGSSWYSANSGINSIVLDTWYMLKTVFNRSNNTISVYLNGILVGTTSMSGFPTFSNDFKLTVGRRSYQWTGDDSTADMVISALSVSKTVR